MRDHSLLLRRAMVAKLLADAGVAAICGMRVYGEQVPADMPTWPSDANPAYVKTGMPVVGPSNPSGINGGDVSFAVHGFAKGPGMDLAVNLSNAIVSALDRITPFALAGGATVREVRATLAQTITDADSPSDFHCIVQFAALTAEPA